MVQRAPHTTRPIIPASILVVLCIAAAGVTAAGIRWESPREVAVGEAYQGPWRMNRSRFHYVDDPTVALTGDGGAGIAWVDNRRQNVFFTVVGPTGEAVLGQPADVSRSPGTFSWLPRMVMTPGGGVYVLWQEIVFSGGSHGGEAFFARSTDGGRSFSAPLNLSNSEAGDGKGRLTRERWHNGSLDLARAPDGTLHAVWTAYQGDLWASRSTDGGRSFSPPLRVAGSDRSPARAPALAIGDDGTVYLAWTVGQDPKADLRLAVSADGGRSFGEPRVVLAGDGHADAPKIAVGPEGALHLVYAEGTDGPFGPHHVRYARLDTGDVAASAARPVSAPGAPGGAHYPGLASAGEGRLVVTWEHYPEGEARPYGLGYSVSTDGGDSFSPPRLIPATEDRSLGLNGSLQGLLMDKVDAGPAGAVAVVNSRFAPGRRSMVRLIRGTLEGVSPGETAGVRLRPSRSGPVRRCSRRPPGVRRASSDVGCFATSRYSFRALYDVTSPRLEDVPRPPWKIHPR